MRLYRYTCLDLQARAQAATALLAVGADADWAIVFRSQALSVATAALRQIDGLGQQVRHGSSLTWGLEALCQEVQCSIINLKNAVHACPQENGVDGGGSEEQTRATYAELQSLVALRQQLDRTVSHLQGLDPDHCNGAHSDPCTQQQQQRSSVIM